MKSDQTRTCLNLVLYHARQPSLIGRLLDIVHSDSKLYLVFEFLDMDLKKYMDTMGDKDGLKPHIVKVSPSVARIIMITEELGADVPRNSTINWSKGYITVTLIVYYIVI